MDVNLVMFRADGSKRVFTLEPGSTTVGRKDDCTIRIPLAVVSRQHAELVVTGNGIKLKNLSQSNGTFLNNRQTSEAQLKAGDQVMIGPVVFTVQIDGKPNDDELLEIRSKADTGKRSRGGIATSKHISTPDDEIDPISALEALASSADATAIAPEEDFE